MQTVQVTFHNLAHSPALVQRMHDKCEALERYHPHIQHCRVTISQEGGHSAALRPFGVIVRVTVPGHELVAECYHPHDAFIAARDAMSAMRRQLKDAASEMRGETKPRAPRSAGVAP